MAKSSSAPAGVIAHARRVIRTHKPAAAATAVVLGAALVSGGIAIAGSGGTADKGKQISHQMRVLDPADGSLTVAGIKIAQMAGICDGHACTFRPPATETVITTDGSPLLPVKAGVSQLFTVTAFDLNHPSATTHFAFRDKSLDVTSVPAGTYQVTLAGVPNGGKWQFNVHVSAAAAAKAHAAAGSIPPAVKPASGTPSTAAAATGHASTAPTSVATAAGH